MFRVELKEILHQANVGKLPPNPVPFEDMLGKFVDAFNDANNWTDMQMRMDQEYEEYRLYSLVTSRRNGSDCSYISYLFRIYADFVEVYGQEIRGLDEFRDYLLEEVGPSYSMQVQDDRAETLRLRNK